MYGQRQWSLKECIAYGLENHSNKVIYENEKKIADAKAKEMLADYLPKVTLNGSLDNNLKVQQSVIPAGVFGPEPRRIAFTQKYNTNLSAQVDQAVYDQSLLSGLKANKYYGQQADLNIAQSKEQIIFNVSNSYCQIFVYEQQRELLQRNIDSYLSQLNVFKLQVERGVMLQKDYDKVKVDYNIALSQILVADGNLKLAKNQLKYEMGFPIDSILNVEKESYESLMNSIGDRLGVEPDIQGRVDYRLGVLDVSFAEIEEKRIKAQMLPKLSIYAKYGAVGFGSTLDPALTDLNPFSAVGLKLSIPVFDIFRQNAQAKQAKFKLLNSRQTLILNSSKYKVEYENAKTEFLKTSANLENDRQNIELAEKVFGVIQQQFSKGVTDLNEWINARNSIKDAQNNYLNSLYAFYTAKLELEKSKGKLQEFYENL